MKTKSDPAEPKVIEGKSEFTAHVAGGHDSLNAAPVPAPAPQSPPKPTVGRIVHYRLAVRDVMDIRDLRFKFNLAPGGDHAEGQIVPAMVVKERTDGSCNLKVAVDAQIPDLWIQNVQLGEKAGTWAWPARA